MSLKKLIDKYSSGAMIKQNYLYNLLLENPEGVTIEKIGKELDCTEKGTSESIKRLRIKYKDEILISKNGDSYSMREHPKHIKENEDIQLETEEKTEKKIDTSFLKKHANKPTVKQEKLYALLTVNPHGVHSEDIKNKFNWKKQDISNQVFLLKNKGIFIERKNGFLRLLNDKPIEKNDENNNINKPIKKVQNESIIKPSILPVEYKNKLKKLEGTDLTDVIDMLKKAYYYQKSAMALIDAKIITDELIDFM